MSRQTHIIRRQSLELAVSSGQEAQRLQDEVQRLFTDRVVPIMDAVMSDQVAEDELLRIDRLELDLGTMDVDRFDEQFVARISDQLAKALASELDRASAPDSWAELPAVDDRVRQPQRVKLENARLQLLLYYLRSGLLPWWSGEDVAFDLASSLSLQLEQHPKRLLQAMRLLPPGRTAARLSRQIGRPLLERVIQDLAEQHGELPARQLKRFFAIVRQQGAPVSPQSPSLMHELLLRQLLQTRPTANTDSGDLFTILVRCLVENSAVDAACLYEGLALQEDVDPVTDPQLIHWLKEQVQQSAVVISQTHGHSSGPRLSQANDERAAAGVTSKTPAAGHQASSADRSKSAMAEASAKRPNEVFEEAEEHPRSDDRMSDSVSADVVSEPDGDALESPDDSAGLAQGVYLDNAGLVLLWPYLPRFFQAIDLADAKNFPGDEQRERAVLMLQYLVSGETQFPEYALLLNKLLCGWPLPEPVVGGIDIHERERREADELLDAVIKNWKTLKNTSRGGLREAFLQREGRLVRDDLGWQIKVNRTAVDVLLESLPWGIGLVRLPWMKAALRVEW